MLSRRCWPLSNCHHVSIVQQSDPSPMVWERDNLRHVSSREALKKENYQNNAHSQCHLRHLLVAGQREACFGGLLAEPCFIFLFFVQRISLPCSTKFNDQPIHLRFSVCKLQKGIDKDVLLLWWATREHPGKTPSKWSSRRGERCKHRDEENRWNNLIPGLEVHFCLLLPTYIKDQYYPTKSFWVDGECCDEAKDEMNRNRLAPCETTTTSYYVILQRMRHFALVEEFRELVSESKARP